MNKRKNNTKSLWKNINFYFILIYTFFSLVFIVQLMIVNILPLKYLIPIIIVLLLILIGMYFLQMGKKVNRINKILGKILIVALSGILGIGNWYLFATNSLFSNITGDNSQTIVISVVVMKKSSVNEISDLKGKEAGYSKTSNQAILNKAFKDFKSDLKDDVVLNDFNTYKELADSLYNENISAIIMDEATRGMFEDEYGDFSSVTRVIKEYKYKTEIKNTSKSVNVTSEPFNVYITGIDTYGTLSTVARSDVNMIASVNPVTHQILLVSVPRDYYVPQTCQNNQKDKLTHTGIYGTSCTIDTMSKFMDIDINYYVRVNFSSLINIVDSLGGVTVDNPTAFIDSEGTAFAFGAINLNGDKALKYSRERYAFSGGDRERGKNQMRVISGIINKAISPTIITNYTSVLNAVSGSFQTNMSNSEMTSFIKKQLNDMSGWTISQYAVDGTGDTNWSPANGFNSYVMQPNMDTVNKAIELMNKVHNGEDISGLV